MQGYKEAYRHFEDLINNMVREKTVNYDRIDSIESVFKYFENGQKIAEEAVKQLEKYKDEE